MESQLSFEDPWYLLLLPLIAAVMWGLRRKHKFPSVRLLVPTTEAFVQKPTWRTLFHRIGQVMLGLATLLAILGLARPQEQYTERDEEAEGIDIMLVMDVSGSMLALDFAPDRLGASKAVAQVFAAERKFDRIGVVAYASEAYTLTPLTLDKRMVDLVLGDLRTGRIGPETAIGMGLATAVNGLKDSEAASKVIILLTDGVNTAGRIDPRTAAELAEEFGIRVYTIGVGTNGVARMPKMLRSGRVVYEPSAVQLDEKLLRDIAAKTGGRYYRATDNTSLAQIYTEIDQLEKTPVRVSVSRRYDDLFYYVLGAAIVMAISAGLIRIWVAPRII